MSEHKDIGARRTEASVKHLRNCATSEWLEAKRAGDEAKAQRWLALRDALRDIYPAICVDPDLIPDFAGAAEGRP